MEEWVKRSASILAEDGERLKKRKGSGKDPQPGGKGATRSFTGSILRRTVVSSPWKTLRVPGAMRLIAQKEAPYSSSPECSNFIKIWGIDSPQADQGIPEMILSGSWTQKGRRSRGWMRVVTGHGRGFFLVFQQMGRRIPER